VDEQNWMSTRETGEVSTRPSLVSEEAFVLPAYPAGKILIEAVPNLTECRWGYKLRYVADRWRMDYNHYRPHSSLDYMAPAAFAAMCLEQDKENCCEILS